MTLLRLKFLKELQPFTLNKTSNLGAWRYGAEILKANAEVHVPSSNVTCILWDINSILRSSQLDNLGINPLKVFRQKVCPHLSGSAY